MVRIDKVTIKNYRNVSFDEFQPAKNGIIFGGKNALGKTTRIEAIYWALSGVLFDNSSKGINDKIKTIKKGKRNPIQVELEITGDYDEKFFLSKTVTERWVSKKGIEEEIYDGDETSYVVNGVSKIKKEYDAIVNKIFGLEQIVKLVSQEVKAEYLKKVNWFNLITNPNYFKRLDKKSQRELLIFTVNDVDVLSLDMSDDVKEILTNATIDEAKKKLKDEIKSQKKEAEMSDVRISTLKNDVNTLVCPHCNLPFEVGNNEQMDKKVKTILLEKTKTLKEMTRNESLLTQIERVEVDYLTKLNEKVRVAFEKNAHIDIVDENLNPTMRMWFRDSNNEWVDYENGINTGDGMLKLAFFIKELKKKLSIPDGIMFFDSIESVDSNNKSRLSFLDEQIFGTEVIPLQQKIIKEYITRTKKEVGVHYV